MRLNNFGMEWIEGLRGDISRTRELLVKDREETQLLLASNLREARDLVAASDARLLPEIEVELAAIEWMRNTNSRNGRLTIASLDEILSDLDLVEELLLAGDESEAENVAKSCLRQMRITSDQMQQESGRRLDVDDVTCMIRGLDRDWITSVRANMAKLSVAWIFGPIDDRLRQRHGEDPDFERHEVENELAPVKEAMELRLEGCREAVDAIERHWKAGRQREAEQTAELLFHALREIKFELGYCSRR